MRLAAILLFACMSAGTLVAQESPQSGPPKQTQNIGRPARYPDGSPFQAGRLPLKQRPSGDQAIIHTVADAMGFIRQPAGQLHETSDDVNRLQWSGTGTMVEGGKKYQVVRYTYGVSLHLNAAREDIRRKSAAGGQVERVVRVVKDDKSWDETTPGVSAKPDDAHAKDRQLEIARTPFGFTRALIKAPAGTAKINDPGASGTITIELPIDGVPTVATLDRWYRPATITQTVDGKKIVASYPDYFDIAEYGVMFPTKVTETVDGQVVFDVKIDDGRVGPYIVFPEPGDLSAAK